MVDFINERYLSTQESKPENELNLDKRDFKVISTKKKFSWKLGFYYKYKIFYKPGNKLFFIYQKSLDNVFFIFETNNKIINFVNVEYCLQYKIEN